MARISITLRGETASYETNNEDMDVNEIFTALKGLLVSHSFLPESIDAYILEAAEDIDKEI